MLVYLYHKMKHLTHKTHAHTQTHTCALRQLDIQYLAVGVVMQLHKCCSQVHVPLVDYIVDFNLELTIPSAAFYSYLLSTSMS